MPETVNGVSFQVDDADEQLVSLHRWYAYRLGRRNWYVMTESAGAKRLYLHRLLMDPPEGMEIDHVDGDGLNNRRSNLRVCSHQQNHQNLRVRRDSRTGVRGVYVHPKRGKRKYQVRIRIGKWQPSFGYYETIEEAEVVSREVRRRYMPHFVDWKIG